MERNISPAAILCIVLVSLAAVIGLGYGAFAITKGSANEGTQEVASQTSYASNSWKDDYDAKDVTGAQVQNLLNEAESKGIAVFINTRGMCQGTINSQSEVPVLKHNGKYYMNYGIVFDYEDDSYKKVSGEVSMSGNSNLLGVRDGSSLKVDANPKLENGQIVKNKDYTGLYTNGAVNFIDTHAKYRSNLIYGNNGEVIGVILSQSSRAGASLPLSSGGGFTNGSGAMGGTSGSYIPSHSGGGNIPMTGGGSSGGSSSSGGNSSNPPGWGTNASGPSTTPSEPVPPVASDEVVITFDTRGGNIIDYQKVTAGFKAKKPSVPVRNGYGFAGWYTDANCSSKFNFDSVVNKNITLYARWFMWGDVNNSGSLTQDDADMVLQYGAGLLGSMPCMLASYIDSLNGPSYTSTASLTIQKMIAGMITNFDIETVLSGCELDLEKWVYYTSSGETKPLPGKKVEVSAVKIPEGGIYYVGDTLTELGNYSTVTATYRGGDYFPATVNAGDIYVYGDYEYRYKKQSSGSSKWNNTLRQAGADGWGVKALDTSKDEYGEILSSINGKDVTTLSFTFVNCNSLTKSPKIPNTIKCMKGTFSGCSNLLSAPKIPDGVSVVSTLFYNCKKLSGEITFNNSNYGSLSSSLSLMFKGTEQRIVLYGTSTQLYDMAATSDKGNVIVAEKIPAGATYYRGVTATRYGDYSGATDTWSAGDTFPTDVKSGDVYVCEDYEYRFNGSFNGYHWVDYDSSQDGWSVVVRDRSKNTYSDMLSSVNGKGVTNLTYAFFECKSLVNAPKLSDNAITMEATFLECYALKTAVIPNKVKILDNTFFVCSAMVTAPSIPNGVKSMLGTFACCDALVNGSTIPSSVTNIEEVYIYCPKLTGSIEINASALTNYGRAFEGTIEPIELSGSCPDLYEIAETDDNDNVFVKNDALNFTINGVKYYFDEGMLWYDWLMSSYNTDGYYSFAGQLLSPSGTGVLDGIKPITGVSYNSPQAGKAYVTQS